MIAIELSGGKNATGPSELKTIDFAQIIHRSDDENTAKPVIPINLGSGKDLSEDLRTKLNQKVLQNKNVIDFKQKLNQKVLQKKISNLLEQKIVIMIKSKRTLRDNQSPKLQKILEIYILYCMPFFQGAASRLPFIYFVPELYKHNLSPLSIGLAIGCYQFCRSLTCCISVPFPKSSQFIGTIIALLGYATCCFIDTDQLGTFIAGTVVIGFCETMPNFQVLLKELYICDQTVLGNKIQMQYIFIILGVLVAFFGGGIIYENYGIKGTSIFGTILMAFEFVACIHTFYIQYTKRQVIDLLPKGEQLKKITLSDIPEEEDQQHGVKFLQQFINFSEQDIKPNWVNYMIALTLGLEAISIGFLLSIGPWFIINQFGQTPSFVGYVFASSAGVSAVYVLLIGNLNKTQQKRFDKISVSTPYNFIFFYCGIGISALGISVTGFKACMTFIFILVLFNDLASVRLNMFNGQISSIKAYKEVCPLAQICRRGLNTVTAISGPILYDIYPQLPFLVAAGISIIWTVVLIFAFKSREKTVKKIVQKEFMKYVSQDSIVFKITQYILLEVIAQQIESSEHEQHKTLDDISEQHIQVPPTHISKQHDDQQDVDSNNLKCVINPIT